jgi:phosphonate transport system substrate-binding protein
MKKIFFLLLLVLSASVFTSEVFAQDKKPPVFAVGMYQPTAELNLTTYKPLADYLSQKLGQPIELKVIDKWAGFVPAFKSGTLDLALMGPWGYVMSHEYAGAEAIGTIEYDGKPTYHAIAITNKPDIKSIQDGKGKVYAFGDAGSTSGYLIPRFVMKTKLGIDPDSYFGKTVNLPHATIETQVAAGLVDLGSDYDRNRNTMIEKGLIKADSSRIIWTSDPLPNDAFAVSKELATNKDLVAKLQQALLDLRKELVSNKSLLPNHYTGFIKSDHANYKMIEDAGKLSGALQNALGDAGKK